MWMLLRWQSFRAKLSNILVERFSRQVASHFRSRKKLTPWKDLIISSSSEITTPPSYQNHALDLLLSTFSALFQSSVPLLFDLRDRYTRPCWAAMKELLEVGIELRATGSTLVQHGIQSRTITKRLAAGLWNGPIVWLRLRLCYEVPVGERTIDVRLVVRLY